MEVIPTVLGVHDALGRTAPADHRDHPCGVWTLPPVRLTAPRGEPADPNFDRTSYDAVGESDRMTLRLVKPAA